MRYEDMVSSVEVRKELFAFCGIDYEVEGSVLHDHAVQKWKADRSFGFQPSAELIDLGEQLGYDRDTMINGDSLMWPVQRRVLRGARSLRARLADWRHA